MKLTEIILKESRSEFREAWNASTKGNPVFKDSRQYDGVEVELNDYPQDENGIYIAGILSMVHGEGFGTKALKKVCELADENNINLYLHALPFGQKYLNIRQLIDWYGRHGFKVVGRESGWGIEMERKANHVDEAIKIKLDNNEDKEDVQAAIKEWHSMSHDNPFMPDMRVYGDTLVDLRPYNDGGLYLTLMALEQGAGHGSKTLKDVCELADKHHLKITLVAKPFGIKKIQKLNKSQLIEWYSRYGFKKKRGDTMVREPK